MSFNCFLIDFIKKCSASVSLAYSETLNSRYVSSGFGSPSSGALVNRCVCGSMLIKCFLIIILHWCSNNKLPA